MQNIIHYFALSISLITACGVFVHDSRIDRATSPSVRTIAAGNMALHKTNSKIQTPDAGVSADAHTHPERTGRAPLKGFSYKNPNPSIQPREQKSKKYMLQNQSPRGRHAFDNHHLPVLA